MSQTGWPALYRSLPDHVPTLLAGVHPGLIGLIVESARNTDAYYSDDLHEPFALWWETDPEKAVRESLAIWVGNVRQHSELHYSGWPAEALDPALKGKTMRQVVSRIKLAKIEQAMIDKLVAIAHGDAAEPGAVS